MNIKQINQAKDLINDLDFKNAEMIDLSNLIRRIVDAIDDIRMGLNETNKLVDKQLLDAVNQINLLLNVAEEKRDLMQNMLNNLWNIVVKGETEDEK